mgnify:CR=1 FL=1
MLLAEGREYALVRAALRHRVGIHARRDRVGKALLHRSLQPLRADAEFVHAGVLARGASLGSALLVAAPMAHNDIKVELPQGKTKEVAGSQEFTVSIKKDGTIYFNSFPVKRHELVESVHKEIKNKEETPIYVRADQAISYGDVIKVVDELKQSGIHYVALSTQPY